MADRQSIAKTLGEIERKISDGEALLRVTGRSNFAGWFFIAIGLLMTLLLADLFFTALLTGIGLLVIAASTWSLFTTAKYRKEIEAGLREYRGRKAELQAELMTRE